MALKRVVPRQEAALSRIVVCHFLLLLLVRLQPPRSALLQRQCACVRQLPCMRVTIGEEVMLDCPIHRAAPCAKEEVGA